MPRVPRQRAFAEFVLALAMSIAPVASDACLFFCGAPAGHAHAATACHSAGAVSADAQLRSPARPCGHDHGRSAGTVAARDDSPSASRASSPALGLGLPASVCAPDSASGSMTVKRSTLQSPSSHPTRLTPLRI
jgi:hypothetical protein